MLLASPFALRRGVELKINWWGRLGVWPAMSALFFALCGLRTLDGGEVELQIRRGQESRSVPLEGAAEAVLDLWRTLP